MMYAIVHKSYPTRAIWDTQVGLPHIYNEREVAEDVAKRLGPEYKVVLW